MEVEDTQPYSFQELAKQKKYLIEQASKELVQKGIDFNLKGVYKNPYREVSLLFAVKRKKTKTKSKYIDRWTWIEFSKNSKQKGWLYGPAHFIAFERSEDYIIINRKVLQDFITSPKCKVRWDMPFVGQPKDAKYRVYINPKTGAKITQVMSKDIIKLPGVQIWHKYENKPKS